MFSKCVAASLFSPSMKSGSICDNLNLAELKHKWAVAVLDDGILKLGFQTAG